MRPFLVHRSSSILAWACCLVLLLGGCVPREDNVVRLRASFWSPPGLEEQIARRFEAAHPGVKVDLLITGGRYAEKVQSMIVAGNEPDVIMVHDTFYHDWAARGVFADLSGLVAELDAADPFLPMPLKVFRYESRHDAVPFSAAAMVAYGNLELLSGAGVAFPWTAFTWDELETLGPRFSRHGGNSEAPTEYLCALPQEWFFLIAYGVRYFDDLYRPREVTVESPQAIAAVNFWRRMHQNRWAVPRSTVLDRGESEMFRDGQLAFLFENRASAKIVKGNPDLKWDIAPLPSPPNGPAAVPHLSAALAISRRSKHPELAREFVRFYLTDEAIRIPTEFGHIVPVRRRQAYGDMLLKQRPPASSRRFVEPLEDGGITAPAYAPGRLEVEAIVRKRLEQSLAAPDVPTEKIVAGLASDLRAWLVKMQQKGLL